MIKVAAVVWLMVGTVIAGALVTAVVAVPQLAEQAKLLIPVGGIGGYVLGLPIAYVVARVIAGGTPKQA